ncbi:putative testis-specific Y-encoded-like protein 3 isoform X8 [Chiroxiphia lanceolata]|uniref:putative testis-specific Y-encoded-like protein 3 isoform X8 n=1 Tax=Chiroxiphia lanceolata TaxID=296741 RepID=UPI0013CE631A|nr:putative testis-specific Y-encoded-like protein 3 isoform X8 [Chiroxiphia lanceolata]
MSGAGPGADLPPPAKLRRLDECSGTGPAAVVPPRREISHPPHPGEGRGARARGGGGGSGHARGGDARAPPGGGTESAMEGPETPEEGMETPKEGMETPKEGMETLKEGMETPVRGMETPKEGMETPKEGMETPVRGMETPKEGMETPKEGMETPVRGMETPKEGMETPEEGMETPKEGMETPKEGMETPKEGMEMPVKGMETPKDGLETPVKGLETLGDEKTPRDETETPKEGLETPKEGLKTAMDPRGDLDTTVPPCLEQENRGLETTMEVMESLEPSRDVLEPSRAVLGGLQPTPMACVGQSRGGPGLPEPGGLPGPVEVPDPPGVPLPKCQEAEESAVISVGEEEEEEEEEDGEEGPGRYLAALEAVQLQLEAVEEEAARAFRRLRARFGLRRRPHLQRRNRLIQHIPGFWVTAFLNHPQLSAMISDRDEDALSYMTSLQVEEFGQSRLGCRIRFFFSVNPYFQNDVVAKEFVRGPSGHLVSHSTPIRWWQGQDPRSRPHKGPPGPRSFFAWFGDHSFPAGDRVAEIIKEELWPNPLQFYLLGEGAEGPPDSESGEDCVVIEDDDEDVQEIPDDGDGSGVEEVLAEDPPEGRMDPAGGRT